MKDYRFAISTGFVCLLLHMVPQNLLQDVINSVFLIHTYIFYSQIESRDLLESQERRDWLLFITIMESNHPSFMFSFSLTQSYSYVVITAVWMKLQQK